MRVAELQELCERLTRSVSVRRGWEVWDAIQIALTTFDHGVATAAAVSSAAHDSGRSAPAGDSRTAYADGIRKCVAELRSDSALRAITLRSADFYAYEQDYDFGRLQRNACALLLTGAAAQLLSWHCWDGLIEMLAAASRHLHEPAGWDETDPAWRQKVETAIAYTSNPLNHEILDEACRALASAGIPSDRVRSWTQWRIESPAARPARIRATLAAIDRSDGEGRLAGLHLTPLEGCREGALIEHLLLALRPLDRDLLETIRRAHGLGGKSGPGNESVCWNIALWEPDQARAFGPLWGPSLGGAAGAAFRTLAEDGHYEPSCLIAATLNADGELGGVGNTKEKVIGALAAWRKTRSGAEAQITTVILADTPASRNVASQFAAVTDKVILRKNVAAAMEIASGVRNGLNQYYEDLKEAPDTLSGELAYLDGRKLSALHVPMFVKEVEYTENRGEQGAHGSMAPPRQQAERRVPWRDVFGNMKRRPGSGIVLTAHGGYGKSQLWRMTLRELADEGQKALQAGTLGLDDLPLPIGLPCDRLAEAGANESSLLDVVTGAFGGHSAELAQYVRRRIERARDRLDEAAQQQLWLVLDAFDQVGDGKESKIFAALRIVDKWSCRIILTSRPEAYQARLAGLADLKTFKQLQSGPTPVETEHRIEPLSPEEQESFLKAWFKADAKNADEMGGWLKQNRETAGEMAGSPFLLTLMSWGFLQLRVIRPEDMTRAHIYDACGRKMLDTPREGPPHKGRNSSLTPVLAEAVCKLFERYRAKDYKLNRDTLEEVLNATERQAPPLYEGKFLPAYERNAVGPFHVAELLDKRILMDAGADRYEFPHRSIAEFLAGWHLAKNPPLLEALDLTPIVKNPVDPEKLVYGEPIERPVTVWEEPVVLGAGTSILLEEDIESYIRKVERNSVIAARCAEEVRYRIGQKLKGDLQSRLLTTMRDVDRVHIWIRSDAGDALGKLGDPRFELIPGAPGHRCMLPPFARVEGGTYTIGEIDTEGSDEKPCEVSPPTFYIGAFHVTNAEYRCFMEAGGYENREWWKEVSLPWLDGATAGSRDGWEKRIMPYWRSEEGRQELNAQIERGEWTKEQAEFFTAILNDDEHFRTWLVNTFPVGRLRQPAFWNDTRFNGLSKPVVGISWHEARAYARWLSANVFGNPETIRLPSEVEHEAAARGRRHRRYAYGDDYNPVKANTGHHLGRTTTVGIYGAAAMEGSQEEAWDLTGNVSCWTRSIYLRDTYGREDETAGSERRVLRGGSWGDHRGLARAAYRSFVHPSVRSDDIGFRVVSVSRPPSQRSL